MRRGYLIPNNQHPQTKSHQIKRRTLGKSEYLSYFIFFDEVGYFHGHKAPASISTGEPLTLRIDNELTYTTDRKKIPGFFTLNAEETIRDATIKKIEDGFDNFYVDEWLCHSSVFNEIDAKDTGRLGTPLISANFLDGLVKPPANIELDDILEFKSKRRPEIEKFWSELINIANNLDIDEKDKMIHAGTEKIRESIDELNTTILEKWLEGVKNSFNFSIKPNKDTIVDLTKIFATFEISQSMILASIVALTNMVDINLTLTPKIPKTSDSAKALAFAWDAQKTFKA